MELLGGGDLSTREPAPALQLMDTVAVKELPGFSISSVESAAFKPVMN